MSQQQTIKMPTTQIILHGTCLEKLKDFPNDHFDSCVTDPPYGLKFMGKKWDYRVPAVDVWAEVLRVLKPGSHILAACGTRTQHRMACNIEDAGFQIRDVITWNYGSGFPKSLDISKAIDKFRVVESGNDITNLKTPNSELQTPDWHGYGTALKPATEFWTLARKPLSEATIVQNVLRHGTGGLNINGSRIGFASGADQDSAVWGRGTDILSGNYVGATHGNGKENIQPDPGGRFPANLILSHHPDCVCVGSKKIKGNNQQAGGTGGLWSGETNKPVGHSYGDDDGNETVATWQCVEDCPIRIMDQQAPKKGAHAPVKSGHAGESKGIYGNYAQKGDDGSSFHDGQMCGASRFFYCAKADKFERNRGLSSFDVLPSKTMGERNADQGGENNNTTGQRPALRQNHHPTVKPIDLMRYLVKLITPRWGHVLDPFNGSGTTGIAAKLELMNYTGIEMDEQYCKISEARIAAWNPERYIKQTLF